VRGGRVRRQRKKESLLKENAGGSIKVFIERGVLEGKKKRTHDNSKCWFNNQGKSNTSGWRGGERGLEAAEVMSDLIG